MDCEEMDALRTVIEYLRESEEKHYEEAGKPAGHIWESALVLERYLDGDPNEQDDDESDDESDDELAEDFLLNKEARGE